MSKFNINEYENQFMNQLLELVKYIDSKLPCEFTQKVIMMFSKLSPFKLIEKYHKNVSPLKQQLTEGDTNIFKKKLYIMPEFDISTCWENLQNDDKKCLENKLLRLIIICNIVYDNNEKYRESEKKLNDVVNDNDDINPFIGIGSNDGMSVNDLSEELKKYENNENGLVKFLLNKMVNSSMVDDMSTIDTNKIDTFAEQFKSQLKKSSKNKDDKLLTDAIDNSIAAIKNLYFKKMNKNNFIDTVTKIGENVAASVMNNEMQPTDIYDSLQSVVDACTTMIDKSGEKKTPEIKKMLNMVQQLKNGKQPQIGDLMGMLSSLTK